MTTLPWDTCPVDPWILDPARTYVSVFRKFHQRETDARFARVRHNGLHHFPRKIPYANHSAGDARYDRGIYR